MPCHILQKLPSCSTVLKPSFEVKHACDPSVVLPESQQMKAEVGLIYDTVPPCLSAGAGDKRGDPLTFKRGAR